MNKIISLLCMCAMTLSSFAVTYTAKVVITMSSANAEDVQVTLRESSILSDGYDNGFDSESPNAEGLYIVASNSKWLQWGTANLEGTQIGFTTGSDESYTFTFTGVVGSTYKLYDAVANVATPITEGGTYGPFSAAANSTFNNRFSIVSSAPVYETSVTTNAYGWASFSYASDVEPLDNSLKVYKGAISDETLNLTEVDYVKAAQGVMIFGAPSTTYYFAVGNGTADFGGNDIKPSSAWASHTGTIYCLKGDALYQYTGSEMPANKAYIQIGGSSAPQRIRMVINGAQGIEDVEATVKAEKFVENGQIFIRRGEHVYDLQGQIVK